MKLLKSKRFKLPKVYFIQDREKIKELPIGVPFIYGDESQEKDIIRVLEYEILYEQAVAKGFKFNFAKILEDYGYDDLEIFGYDNPVYMDIASEELKDVPDGIDLNLKSFTGHGSLLKKFIRDSAVYLDIKKLKALNVFPVWLDNIEKSVNTNLHNFAVFNSNMYNKKLDGMYGGISLTSPKKNLLIVDISGSIPKGVSSVLLSMAKNFAETFYADLMITGSKSTLYPYEEIRFLNVDNLFEKNGMGNDQTYFRKLVTESNRSYKTAIVFGDGHSPCYAWSNEFNRGNSDITIDNGKKLCNWSVEKLISLHTSSETEIAGYGQWFTPKTVEHITDWVKYL